MQQSLLYIIAAQSLQLKTYYTFVYVFDFHVFNPIFYGRNTLIIPHL